MEEIMKKTTCSTDEQIEILVSNAEGLCHTNAPYFNDIYNSRIISSLGTD